MKHFLKFKFIAPTFISLRGNVTGQQITFLSRFPCVIILYSVIDHSILKWMFNYFFFLFEEVKKYFKCMG